MSLAPNGGLGVGLGYASTLLQVHLGLGLKLALASTAVSSVPALRKQLQGAPWEATLKAAAATSGPVPLLAAFALIQAVGAAPDLLTWAGLLASTASVLLSSLVVVLCPCFGLEVPEVNERTGDVLAGSFADGGRLAGRFAAAARALSSLRACGQALLIMGSPPAGMQLLCASVLMRLAFAVHAAGGAARALGLAPLAKARTDAECALAAVPLVASLALMDYVAWGPGSALLAPVHPVLYCALASLAQVGLLLVSGGEANGSAHGAPRAELDPSTSGLGHVASASLYAALAASLARILAGTVSVAASTSGLSVRWGEPLFAAAALLAALLLAVHLAEFLLFMFKPEAEAAVAATNGCEGTEDHAAEAEPPAEPVGTVGYLKALVAPAHGLLLALVACHLGLPKGGDPDALGAALSLLTGPFQYGFLLAAAGVVLQVAMFLLFALCHCDAARAPEPPLDGTGTLQWQPEGATAKKAAGGMRQATLVLLEGGLLLGWVGMGAWLWLALGLTLGPCVALALPPEVRRAAGSAAGACAGSLKGVSEFLAARMEAYMKQRQHQMEVRHAQKADAVAAEVERELATAAPPAEAKASKPKGPQGKAAPGPVQAKAGKPKSGGKAKKR